MKKKNKEPSIYEQIIAVFKAAFKAEFTTDAGRVNSLGFLVIALMAVLILLPDTLFTILNTILSFFGRSLPQLPDNTITAFIIGALIYMIWCVWILFKVDQSKKI